jgi:hypothetical protein
VATAIKHTAAKYGPRIARLSMGSTNPPTAPVPTVSVKLVSPKMHSGAQAVRCNVMVYVPKGVEDEVVTVAVSVFGEEVTSICPSIVVPVDA